MPIKFPKVAQLKTAEKLRNHIASITAKTDIDAFPVDDEILTTDNGSPMATPFQFGSKTVGNRWCIHPMEGWDGNTDGTPTDHTRRRWRRFGASGAKLIWGGEAIAVQPGGRANPNQLMLSTASLSSIDALYQSLLETHAETNSTASDLVVGLQLTHSGRFSRPNSKRLEPRIAYHHPLLDQKCEISPTDDSVVWTDAQIDSLIGDYVETAKLAEDIGFDFVDVKACHGYLLHEFLSARPRHGPYGGSLENRSRLLRTIISEIRSNCPHLEIGVRLSLFDSLPFQKLDDAGQPVDCSYHLPYLFGFGCNANDPLDIDLTEPIWLIHQLKQIGVAAINLSCGSPYYNPHLQRPAAFPPSDGYPPPEDPLLGVARQMHACRQIKLAIPKLPLVGSGYSYLQDFLPHVAQSAVRSDWIDSVGLGRMVLSYPELPRDTLTDGKMKRKRVCRTFSDCTTAPRLGMISGCFPLDDHFKSMPESNQLKRQRPR